MNRVASTLLTERYLDVESTFSERFLNVLDVNTTLCGHSKNHFFKKNIQLKGLYLSRAFKGARDLFDTVVKRSREL